MTVRFLIIGVLALVTVGGTVFCALVWVAASRHRRRRSGTDRAAITLSVLKPLAGLDLELVANLRSFFALDYPDFELHFCVREADDPAADVARQLIDEHPGVRATLVVAGEPPSLDDYPNAKTWNLLAAAECATGEILVISDSDIRAVPDDLAAIAAEFADPRVGVVTCPYRAVAGPSLWSRLEAVGMDTEFWGGVFVAAMLAPMDFAVGPTMAVRRACLDEIGGFEATRDYLAEDFVIGQRARALGWDVRLARRVVEHRIGSQGFAANLRHRLRWYRSTRRSRPLGYAAQAFTYPLPFALAALATAGGAAWAWALVAAVFAARLAAAQATARALAAPSPLRRVDLLLAQDFASFAVWLLAFWGRRVDWRSRTFELGQDGRLRPLR